MNSLSFLYYFYLQKTEDGGDGDNKVVSGVINELVGEDASVSAL